jgi:acetyl/propionyl-CoA carboxylase alpha subunit
MLRKVLIANRGEIAVRIIATCRSMGLQTVAVYSDADATAVHVAAADEAVHIGAAPASESYLRIDALIAAAKRTHAHAIHPGMWNIRHRHRQRAIVVALTDGLVCKGYGFLSENSDFAARCADEGIVFIGPTPSTIEAMGSKVSVRLIPSPTSRPTHSALLL